ncbi:MAG: lysoplasmalogenase [Bacteroidota bacterium]
MKKQSGLILFLITLLADLTGILLNNEWLQYVSKPLIVPALIFYFLCLAEPRNYFSGKWIVFGLFFSWAGDVLLMFVTKNEAFFLLGLASFLLAHIFYILFFQRVIKQEKIKIKPLLVVIVVTYYAALIIWLYPNLLDMKVPVLVYGLVISTMFLLAMHMLFIGDKVAGKWMMAGALLFVLSDSTLAINKFYQPFEAAGIIIMLTYGFAQLFIVKGATSFINSVNKE